MAMAVTAVNEKTIPFVPWATSSLAEEETWASPSVAIGNDSGSMPQQASQSFLKNTKRLNNSVVERNSDRRVNDTGVPANGILWLCTWLTTARWRVRS
jgi:hypothetical protein